MDAALRRLLDRPIAHRGLHGCGRAGWPVENSLSAAAAAAQAGWGIECDVRLSRDGEVMVFHDAELGRLTDTQGRLADRDAADLAALRLGYGDATIPTLRDLLSLVAGTVPVVVEVKAGCAPTLVDQTLALAHQCGGWVAVESFEAAVVLRARELGAACPIGLVGPAEDGSAIPPGIVERCDFLSWSVESLEDVAELGWSGALTTWTVRTPAQQARASGFGAQIVFEGFPPVTRP